MIDIIRNNWRNGKRGLGINEVISMYYPMHEADLMKFVNAADSIIERNKNKTSQI